MITIVLSRESVSYTHLFQTFQIVFLPCLGSEQYYRDVVQVHILLYFVA